MRWCGLGLCLVLGCQAERGLLDTESEVHDVHGLTWVRPDLAGMPLPSSADLDALQASELDLLITLTEAAPDVDALRERDIASVWLPVEDFTAPTQQQLHDATAAIQRTLDAGGRAGVHCRAGLGRTGTVLAAWFVTEGLDGPQAIAEIRSLRPGSIETVEQEQAVIDFAGAAGGGPTPASGPGW